MGASSTVPVEADVEAARPPAAHRDHDREVVVHLGTAVPGDRGPLDHDVPLAALQQCADRAEPEVGGIVAVRQVVGVEHHPLHVDLAVADADVVDVGHRSRASRKCSGVEALLVDRHPRPEPLELDGDGGGTGPPGGGATGDRDTGREQRGGVVPQRRVRARRGRPAGRRRRGSRARAHRRWRGPPGRGCPARRGARRDRWPRRTASRQPPACGPVSKRSVASRPPIADRARDT